MDAIETSTMNGVACSKNQFEQAVQHFVSSATSKDAAS